MWEKATEMILKREELVGKLEKFERLASDPNRFFEKGRWSRNQEMNEFSILHC